MLLSKRERKNAPQKKLCVLITGASSGIGAALALAYASPDCVLGLIGRNTERLNAVAKQCQKKGANVNIGQLDLTDPAALKSWVQSFDNQFPVTLLIANAGITNQIAHEKREKLDDIKRLLDTNLYAVINTIDAVLPTMQQRGSGQVVLVSSLAAYRGMPVTPAYCASKAAVKSYGEALRGWLAPEGIKVNVICPGFVASNMSNNFDAPKPFMLTAEKAAEIIKHGLKKNRAIISFPFPLTLGMWLLAVMPFPFASFFLGILGYNRPP